MGLHIMSDRFFSVGDVVKYRDIEGVVIGFTMKSTTIRCIDDRSITTVCNRNISEITRLPKPAQVDIDLPVSYDEEPGRIIASDYLKQSNKKVFNTYFTKLCFQFLLGFAIIIQIYHGETEK